MLDGARLKQLARHKPVVSSATSSSFCLLSSLYHDLVLRCLGLLDIPSLCRMSTTCRWLRSTSEDWELWSELYVSRWPVDRERTERKERWKADYRDKEMQEEAAFFAQDNDDTNAALHGSARDERMQDEESGGRTEQVGYGGAMEASVPRHTAAQSTVEATHQRVLSHSVLHRQPPT